MALVTLGKPGRDLTGEQPQPSWRARQGLDRGLLVHRDHHRMLGQVQIQAHSVGSLGSELRRCSHTSYGAVRAKCDACAAHARLGRWTRSQGHATGTCRSSGRNLRWALVHLREDAPLDQSAIGLGCAWMRRVRQPGQSRSDYRLQRSFVHESFWIVQGACAAAEQAFGPTPLPPRETKAK